MKLRIVLAASAVLALTACGKSASTNDAANSGSVAEAEPAITETAPAAKPAAPAAGAAPTRDYLIGKWAMMDDDCSLTVEYKADGTLLGPKGEAFDRWQLNGAELTLASNPGQMTLSVIDQNHMETRRDGEDPPKRIARC